jgi:hypothetical protein
LPPPSANGHVDAGQILDERAETHRGERVAAEQQEAGNLAEILLRRVLVHGLDHGGPWFTLEQIAHGAGLERGEELFAVVKHRDNHADEFRPQRTQFLDGHDAGLAGEIDVAEQDLRPARRQSRQGRLGTGEFPDHLATP